MGAMGILSLIGSGISAANGISQGKAAREQGAFTAAQMEKNAKFAEAQAEDALKRGEKDVQAVYRKGKQVAGAQRAAFAAQGIEVDTGSAAGIQADTAAITSEDALTAKNNAWREAWGYRVQAEDMRMQGAMAKKAGETAARNSLITGGLNALDYGVKAYGHMSGGGGKKGGGKSAPRVSRGGKP